MGGWGNHLTAGVKRSLQYYFSLYFVLIINLLTEKNTFFKKYIQSQYNIQPEAFTFFTREERLRLFLPNFVLARAAVEVILQNYQETVLDFRIL